MVHAYTRLLSTGFFLEDPTSAITFRGLNLDIWKDSGTEATEGKKEKKKHANKQKPFQGAQCRIRQVSSPEIHRFTEPAAFQRQKNTCLCFSVTQPLTTPNHFKWNVKTSVSILFVCQSELRAVRFPRTLQRCLMCLFYQSLEFSETELLRSTMLQRTWLW